MAEPVALVISYCGSQHDISRLHTRTGASVLAALGAFCTRCMPADATTIFGAVLCADCFTGASAAKAETVKNAAQDKTILRARMIQSS